MTSDISLSGLRVLVIEDEALIAMVLEDYLGEFGCTIIGPASNIADGYRLIESGGVDVALLDLNLGRGITSFELATGAGAVARFHLPSHSAPIASRCGIRSKSGQCFKNRSAWPIWDELLTCSRPPLARSRQKRVRSSKSELGKSRRYWNSRAFVSV